MSDSFQPTPGSGCAGAAGVGPGRGRGRFSSSLSQSFTSLCLAVLALGVSGCAHLFPRASQPTAHLASLRPVKGEPVPMEVLELETMRYADGYAVAVAQAADDFIAKASTSEARIAGVRWKLSQATAAYIDATGPNAVLNVLDLVVLATASRMVLEDQAVDVFGEAALPVLDGQ